MSLRRGLGKAAPGSDPLTACLDANGTYICTAFNPRCYIIQKVHPSSDSVTPSAEESREKRSTNVGQDALIGWESLQSTSCLETNQPFILDGYVYMNGDVGKLPSGAVLTTTPETSASIGSSDYVALNGIAEGAEGLSSNPPSAPQDNTSAFPLPQLKQMLSQQLEYYFSRENLANDTYLLSQMDNDQYVPIWTVANFNQVKKLTKDIKLITEVLRESPNVQVDEDGVKVRPNHKRCIVILREIPDNTPLEEVKNLFAGDNCPRFISCEFAHNSSWYVTFESDEDAQRAYRYLREEVREFQGKPIMARIKAKPMNRLPLPPVTVKNGFRATPPPTAVYDPGAFPPGQQRFIYTNGTPGQPVTFNHVPVYQAPYSSQQFYAWPTTAPGYLDISSVFSVNGLAPQPFKPTPYRPSNTRPRKTSRVGSGNDQTPQTSSNTSGTQNRSQTVNQAPASVSPQATVKVVNKGSNSAETHRPGIVHSVPSESHDAHTGPIPVGMPVINPDGLMDVYRYMPTALNLVAAKEIVAPRHRRKKEREDGVANSQVVQGQAKETAKLAPFDLVEEAFPPLPGLDAGTQSTLKQSQTQNSNVEVLQSQTSIDALPQGHWGENRLADVVKGTAKSKGGSKESSNAGDNDSPRATSPQFPQCNQITRQTSISSACIGIPETKDMASESGEIQLSTVTLTPPSSPEKLVPVPLQVKCTMADKSTKTDDALLNGDMDSLPCPTTTNAATMTTVVPIEAPSRPTQVGASSSVKTHISVHRQESKQIQQPPSPPPFEYSGNPPRMSYAQVAQHHKEVSAQKERQAKEKNASENQITGKQSSTTNSSTNTSSSSRVPSDRDNRETRENGQQRDNQTQRHSGPNRNGSRASHERSQRRRPEARTSQLRDFVTPRSPK